MIMARSGQVGFRACIRALLWAHDLMGDYRNAAGSAGIQGEVHLRQHPRPRESSERQNDGHCHVYVVLPGATCFTTAGSFEIRSDRGGISHGRFVYCNNYLVDPEAVPLDPSQLGRLSGAVHRTTMFDGVFSSLRDASPQQWGRRVIKHTAPLEPRGDIDFLLQSPDDRSGALGFGKNFEPPAPKRKFYRIPDLEKLAAIAETIIVKEERHIESNSERIRAMIPFRTSMGGARPKAVVEDAEGLWLAKFNHRVDGWNYARLEHAMLNLAKICGIRSVHSRVETVAGRTVLLLERFDRKKTKHGYLRYRTISGYTALRTDRAHENRKDWRYASLAEELRRIVVHPIEDSKELFRRMVFNALISKTDDGPGSHSIIADRSGWKLSPAYDLIPVIDHDDPDLRLLAMNCGIYGQQATARNLVSECGRFLLGEEEAAAIIDSMEERVRNGWYRAARNAGVSETECETISVAIAYRGFRRVTGSRSSQS